MVQILAPLFGAALLFSGVMAAPRPDSSINEPAVSSPNGIPITEGASIGTPVKAYDAPMATQMMSESTSAKMMMEASSKMMMESSSSMMMEKSKMMEATSTSKMMEAMTTSAPTSTMYGSGSSGSSGYDNCVMQCMNTYGAPAAQYTPPPMKSEDKGSSGGDSGGKVHTVIVAPMKGVLRFVPFALNATVGDTIHYVWGAGPHTVTRSSVLEPCNKTTDASAFNSGAQNATATFDQKVNDTNPLFFYCNVPGHCQKGMFGIVNPPSAPSTATTVAQMMPQWIANSTAMATLAMYTNNQTKGTSAATWGDSIDVATIPTWAHAALAENVMYTRLLFASNPGMLEAGTGAGYPDGRAVSTPGADFDTLLANTPDAAPAANAGDAASSSAPVPSSTGSSAAASPTASKKSGASTVSSSALLVGVIAIAATFFAL